MKYHKHAIIDNVPLINQFTRYFISLLIQSRGHNHTILFQNDTILFQLSIIHMELKFIIVYNLCHLLLVKTTSSIIVRMYFL